MSDEGTQSSKEIQGILSLGHSSSGSSGGDTQPYGEDSFTPGPITESQEPFISDSLKAANEARNHRLGRTPSARAENEAKATAEAIRERAGTPIPTWDQIPVDVPEGERPAEQIQRMRDRMKNGLPEPTGRDPHPSKTKTEISTAVAAHNDKWRTKAVEPAAAAATRTPQLKRSHTTVGATAGLLTSPPLIDGKPIMNPSDRNTLVRAATTGTTNTNSGTKRKREEPQQQAGSASDSGESTVDLYGYKEQSDKSDTAEKPAKRPKREQPKRARKKSRKALDTEWKELLKERGGRKRAGKKKSKSKEHVKNTLEQSKAAQAERDGSRGSA